MLILKFGNEIFIRLIRYFYRRTTYPSELAFHVTLQAIFHFNSSIFSDFINSFYYLYLLIYLFILFIFLFFYLIHFFVFLTHSPFPFFHRIQAPPSHIKTPSPNSIPLYPMATDTLQKKRAVDHSQRFPQEH